MFMLSARLGQTFYYLAAVELFRDVLGPFFQGVGVYSIRRGLADRASIAQTLELWEKPNCHLVIFPEGGCSFQNDTVMPFRIGAVQLAFQGMNRVAKQTQDIPDLYTVPVSIKYRYTGRIYQVIDKTLADLEQAFAIPKKATRYDRLRAIATQVLVSIENEYGISASEIAEQTWNQRIASLKAKVLEQCEQQFGLISAPGEANRERVYRILNTLQTRTEQIDTGEMVDEHPWEIAFVQKSMLRVLNFDAIYDGYVAAAPTPERFLDTLIRLEREVFGIDKPPPKGHRVALLRIGNPINLKDHFEAFQKNKVETVSAIAQQLQNAVQTGLNNLQTK